MPKTLEQLTEEDKELIMEIFMSDGTEEEILKRLEDELPAEIQDAASDYLALLFGGGSAEE